MALSKTLARATHYSVAYLIANDGGPGATLTLSSNDFTGVLVALGFGGALLDLLTDDVAANSQAIQRARMLGDASGLASADLSDVPHCEVIITARNAFAWAVDADVDAVTPTRGELNISAPTKFIGSALVALEFRHTYAR